MVRVGPETFVRVVRALYRFRVRIAPARGAVIIAVLWLSGLPGACEANEGLCSGPGESINQAPGIGFPTRRCASIGGF